MTTLKILDIMMKDKKRIGQGLVVVMMRDDFSFEKVVDFGESELMTAMDKSKRLLAIPRRTRSLE